MSLTLGKTTFMWAFIVTLANGQRVGAISEAATEEMAVFEFRKDSNVKAVELVRAQNPSLGADAIGACLPLDLAVHHLQESQRRDRTLIAEKM